MPSMNPYDVIVIDPPWPMKLIKRRVRPKQVELAYRTMTLKEIESNIGEQLAGCGKSLKMVDYSVTLA